MLRGLCSYNGASRDEAIYVTEHHKLQIMCVKTFRGCGSSLYDNFLILLPRRQFSVISGDRLNLSFDASDKEI